MIFEYGFSLIGKSHISNEKCCQDAHRIMRMENGWIIAAVADGVGSAANSQIGSRIAVDTVVQFCNECMPYDYNIISIKSMMRTAYNYAFKCIARVAENENNPIENYDTTLSMVIYDGKRIIYGHSGDGAIIGLTTFGDYVEITKPQKGSDGVTVIPLRGGYTNWEIDTYEEDLAAVMLMTDGMLETLCPYLLRDIDNKINKVYVPLASYFCDPSGFFEGPEKEKITKKLIEDFLIAGENYPSDNFYVRLLAIYKQLIPNNAVETIENIKKNNYPVMLMQNEQDDKTLVVLVNKEVPVDIHNSEFYDEPDWNALQDAWNRKAYPHLYQDNPDQESKSDHETDDKGIPIIAGLEVPSGVATGIEAETDSDGEESDDESSDTSSSPEKGIVSSVGDTKTRKKPASMKKEEDELDIVPISTGKSVSSKQKIQSSVKLEAMQPRHDKPRKKSWVHKIGDFFES